MPCWIVQGAPPGQARRTHRRGQCEAIPRAHPPTDRGAARPRGVGDHRRWELSSEGKEQLPLRKTRYEQFIHDNLNRALNLAIALDGTVEGPWHVLDVLVTLIERKAVKMATRGEA